MSETPEQPEKPDQPGTCESCRKAPVSVHIRRVTAEGEEEMNLCQDCARDRGVDAENSETLPADPVAQMIKSIAGVEATGTCPGCGYTFSRFRETGRLGCAQCYAAFAEELRPLLRRVQGFARHAGKAPVRDGEEYEAGARLRRLSEDLERAIEDEDYERAAKLRDLIQSLDAPSRES